MTPDEERAKLKRLKESSQGPMFALAVISIALFVAVTGTVLYMYLGSNGTPVASAACPERFRAMDAVDENGKLEYRDFLTYGKMMTSEEFAKADRNRDNALSLDEFCTWTARATG